MFCNVLVDVPAARPRCLSSLMVAAGAGAIILSVVFFLNSVGDENGVLMKSLPDTNWDRIDLLEQAINAEIHQVFDKWREKIASEQSTPV